MAAPPDCARGSRYKHPASAGHVAADPLNREIHSGAWASPLVEVEGFSGTYSDPRGMKVERLAGFTLLRFPACREEICLPIVFPHHLCVAIRIHQHGDALIDSDAVNGFGIARGENA